MMNKLKMFRGLLALTFLGVNASFAGDDMDNETWEEEVWETLEDDEGGFEHERAETSSARDEDLDIRVSQEELASAINQRSVAIFGDSNMSSLSTAVNFLQDNVDHFADLIASVSAKYRWNKKLLMSELAFRRMVSRAYTEGNLPGLALDLFKSNAAGYINAQDYHLTCALVYSLGAGNPDFITELIELSHQVQFKIEDEMERFLVSGVSHASRWGADGSITRIMRGIQYLIERNILSTRQVQQWLSKPSDSLRSSGALIESLLQVILEDMEDLDFDMLAWTLSLAVTPEGVLSIDEQKLLIQVLMMTRLNQQRLNASNIQALIQVIKTLVLDFGANPRRGDGYSRPALKIVEGISDGNLCKDEILEALEGSNTK